VRAYYRKQWLDRFKEHRAVLAELFGADIALYPAHLATLNLAAREINDEANYPRVRRTDFFEIEAEEFCTLPPKQTKVPLPELEVIIGNPPYVRQEKIPDKKKLAEVAARRWPGLKFSGRSDIHCYFWPAAAKFLREGGYFGFLTSSSWLDVEYGFALQRWILGNFKIIAILESVSEPWFEDARVKTCATILQRCSEAPERNSNLVKFVRVKAPLTRIIGMRTNQVEARFRAFDALRDRISDAKESFEDEQIRVIVKPQEDLWREGIRSAATLVGARMEAENGDEGEAEPGEGIEELTLTVSRDDSRDRLSPSGRGLQSQTSDAVLGEYAAGKWGRYLRAPSFYFETFYGRFAGTEGNLKTEVVDVRLIEVPDLREATAQVRPRLEVAFDRLSRRTAGRMVEEQLMECHSPEWAAQIAAGPLVLPEELKQADRRELDDGSIRIARRG
jgi:hypothetical protein